MNRSKELSARLLREIVVLTNYRLIEAGLDLDAEPVRVQATLDQVSTEINRVIAATPSPIEVLPPIVLLFRDNKIGVGFVCKVCLKAPPELAKFKCKQCAEK